MELRKKLVFVFVSFLCFSAFSQEFFQDKSFVKVWETAGGLETPESALFDEVSGKIYVSNIAGRGWDTDSVGFISILNTKGEIEKIHWVNGLSAPKGMAIYKNSLFVADIDRLVKIDIASGKIVRNYHNLCAVTLNDVAADVDGTIYVTDSNNKRILCLKNDSLKLFIESDELLRINGILVEGNHLLCGSYDSKMMSVHKVTKEITILRSDVGYIDGFIKIGKHKYLVSNFKGMISEIDLNAEPRKLLDTSSLKVHAADLGYISKHQLVLVPTFNFNKLVAYKLLK